MWICWNISVGIRECLEEPSFAKNNPSTVVFLVKITCVCYSDYQDKLQLENGRAFQERKIITGWAKGWQIQFWVQASLGRPSLLSMAL